MTLTKPSAKVIDTGLALGLVAALCAAALVERVRSSPGEPGKVTVGRKQNMLGFSSIYELRTVPDKEKWVAAFGGTRETELAVQAGLNWLARHQAEAGWWSADCLGPQSKVSQTRCEEQSPCTHRGSDEVMAQTGLALLALQAAGNYDFNKNPYARNVRRGLYWLADQQAEDGSLALPSRLHNHSHKFSFMYSHAIATFALAEACAVRKAQRQPDDVRFREAAAKAVDFIESVQHSDGGWRYSTNPDEGSDTSVSGWAMLALKSALEAGIPVLDRTVERTRVFFESCEHDDGRTSYLGGRSGGTDALTAVGMLTHQLLLKDPDSPLVKKASSYLVRRADTHRRHVENAGPEFYILYNVTLAMHQAGGDEWKTWNETVRDAVVARQMSGPGCERGSWDPQTTHGGNVGGRIYSTALGTLMLEVYYRFSRKVEKAKP